MNRRERLLAAAVLASCSLAVAQQQVGSVRGLVRDKEFDAPLPGVQVQVVETGQKVPTNAQGNFVVEQLRAGKYTLVFSKEGYVRQVKADVVVSAGQLTDLTVLLAGDFTDMDEFVVQDVLKLGGGSDAALLQLRLDSPALMDSVGADLMSKAGASDAAAALRLVPGATVQDGKSAVIRGLPDRYVSSQMNGVRLPTADADKRAVELDQFPAAVIESLQVSKTFTPDQQGDASGGAVNVKLRGVPEEPFFVRANGQYSWNSQVRYRDDFLGYRGGGIRELGRDDGRRNEQPLGQNWDGAVGAQEEDAPLDYRGTLAIGGKHELADGVKVGGFVNLFYERDSAFWNNGRDDSYWVENPGDPMTPRYTQGAPQQDDFKTQLFDIVRGQRTLQAGALSAFGVETERHRLSLVHLYSRTTEDTATVAEDTRGKQYFYPGHDPNDPTSPGFTEQQGAPYLRLETLAYTERTTDTLQLSGRHSLGSESLAGGEAPELDWAASRSTARSNQPDKRQFGTQWIPGFTVPGLVVPSVYLPFKPAANFTLGNLQRIYTRIQEESEQYAVNVKAPLPGDGDRAGYLKFGVFLDKVDRAFDQNTFSNFNDNSTSNGPFEVPWSRNFGNEPHPITASTFDVDYRGEQDVWASYAMFDLPLGEAVKAVGGVRFESTAIGVVNTPEADALWFPPGSLAPTALTPGAADVDYEEDRWLPALGLEWTPAEGVTFRAAYSETLARQTFKELTPILQQEYLGGPVFIGNPDLEMSSLRNYDLRLDWVPYEGGLLSASWFHKDIRDPIEYVQQLATFDFTTAFNYPKGRLQGFELETQQRLGQFVEALDGLSVGANATFIDATVTLPEFEAAQFELPNIAAPMRKRDMTNAPEHLYNFFLQYEVPGLGTQLGLFYTVTGDTLVAGAGQANGNYVPNLYAKDFETLNFSLQQPLGEYLRLQIGARNLTNPAIKEIYRSPYIGPDVTKTSYTTGVELAISLGMEIRF